MNKKVVGVIGAMISVLISVVPAFAHVSVKPASVGVGVFQTFSVGVPTEKEVPTVGLRIVLPAGLSYVTPNVKTGWTVTVKKTGEGESATTTEISWTGGSIPAGQRDEFMFSAQVPASETTLIWKAYQTYQDGEVISWDREPNGSGDETVTPYSQTTVINDLVKSESLTIAAKASDQSNRIVLIVSMVSAILSVIAIGIQLRRKV